MINTSAIILAGGRGKRLGYKEKALMPINGKPIIEYTIEVLEGVVDEIIVSVRDDRQKQLLKEYTTGHIVVVDKYVDTGPLAGILEGLGAAVGEYVFVVACDMPFLNAGVVGFLFKCAKGHDGALPVRSDGIYEPLHAVYRTGPMLAGTEKAIEHGERFILAPIFDLEDMVHVEMDKIRELDPKLKTFLNVNTLEDIEKYNI
ncbi:MAG TPA: molybdenum cofactor guanylyltransferase [Methanosarcinales archaeon]|nr:molybdenum cofactor guanylyltransferase [Methanosarcinales archaeon]